MQAALDATALMLSKEAPDANAGNLNQKANDIFKTMFTRPEAYNLQVATTFTQPQQGSFSLTMKGSATVNTMFSKILGQATIDLSATSEVIWGIKKLNLALVLDNTGSMASSQKMTNLKTAAHNLLTTLKNAAKQPGDIKVAIVPFATDVNADKGERGRHLDRLDRLGDRQRHLQQFELSLQIELRVERQDLDAGAAQPVERLCLATRTTT